MKALDKINNTNPKFYNFVYAKRNMVAQFGTDTERDAQEIFEEIKSTRTSKGLVTTKIETIKK